MLNFRKQLPQLDPLISFEAAARHSSFALASKELNVTASAVSQQIRVLENQLGVPLFVRRHRSVQLTDRGKEFHNSVSVALMHLMNAANEIKVTEGSERLEIATDTSIASLWLMPRLLSQFEREFPDISFRITATDVQADLLSSEFQIALVHGEGKWRGFDSEILFAEEVFPVCSPSFLESWNGEFTTADLAHCNLLDLEYEQWNWMNWSIWLTEKGLPLSKTPRRLSMNNYPLIIDAAKQGAGVALGWRYLIDDEITKHTLVRPVADTIKTSFAYHIVWPFNAQLSPNVLKFRDWIIAERDALK